jgi:hypothetical protein
MPEWKLICFKQKHKLTELIASCTLCENLLFAKVLSTLFSHHHPSILWKFHKFFILYLNSFIIISALKEEISWNYCCRHALNCFHPCNSSVAKFNSFFSFSIFRNHQMKNNWNYFNSKRAQNKITIHFFSWNLMNFCYL